MSVFSFLLPHSHLFLFLMLLHHHWTWQLYSSVVLSYLSVFSLMKPACIYLMVPFTPARSPFEQISFRINKTWSVIWSLPQGHAGASPTWCAFLFVIIYYADIREREMVRIRLPGLCPLLLGNTVIGLCRHIFSWSLSSAQGCSSPRPCPLLFPHH